MSRASRAAVVVGPRRTDLIRRACPEPGPAEVRVALEGCGVCGSNAPVWEGRPWFEYPLSPGAPGHEGWGRVDVTGDGVAGLPAGTPVALLAEDVFAEHAVVPADRLVALPAELGSEPFPGEALGCAFNVAAGAGFAPGHTVAVVGIGFIGAVVTALAVGAGATVIAVSRRPFSLDVAKTMGAHDLVCFGDRHDTAAAVARFLPAEGCDVVVEAVGTQASLDVAGDLTRIGGRLVIAGYHQDGTRTVDLGMWNWRGLDVVNAHERDPEVAIAGIQAAAWAVAEGSFDPSPLYTHRYPLDRLGEAMDAMTTRPDGFLKALVCP